MRQDDNSIRSARGVKRRELLKGVGAAAAAKSLGGCSSDATHEMEPQGQAPQAGTSGTPAQPTAATTGTAAMPVAGTSAAPTPSAAAGTGSPQRPGMSQPAAPQAGGQAPNQPPPAQGSKGFTKPEPQEPAVPATPGADTTRFFPGFTNDQVKTTGATINLAKGGDGPPLLLLHGAPYTHVTWRLIAPELAKKYTIVATDLRGYGDSSKSADTADHSNYSKRNMAFDQVEVMQHYGFDKFAVVGHDRGGRVAQRMALDHPDKVTKIAVIDIVPTYYSYTHVTLEFVQAYFHWFNYLRAAPGPENELMMQNQSAMARASTDAQKEYARVNAMMANIHGMCEDYRAGASIDLEHDAADIDKKIMAPLLTLWATGGSIGKIFDVMAIWKDRAQTVTGKQLSGGHSLQEDAADAVLAELTPFLAS